MENPRYKWREAFIFTQAELRGLRLLSLFLVLSIVARVSYFHCIEPNTVVFQLPQAWSQQDTLLYSDSNSQAAYSQPQRTRSKWTERKWPVPEVKRDCLVHHSFAAPFRRSRIVEINTADTIELRGLPAIGPWLARKIVEYRDRLGGFYSAEQLLDVYRLTPGKLDTIWPFLSIDTTVVRRIDINQISAEELMRHPYLSRSQARALIAYREKHGDFHVLADLKKCLLIDEKTFDKMRDYVEVR
jgi:competence ComEA-like helix-hairpin-helix protein